MIRRLSYCILAALLLIACNGVEPDAPKGPYIELKVQCNELPETKDGYNGTMDGVDRYNENLISYVDFFFFPGTEATGHATFHVRKESGQRNFDVFRIDNIDSDVINSRIFPVIPNDVRDAIVFAVANYPGTMVADESDLSAYTMEYLEGLRVTTDFVTPERQPSFVMTGQAALEFRGRNQIMAATGSVQLSRLACKMTVAVKIDEMVIMDNLEVWYPMLEQMELYLVDGAKTVKLGGIDPEPEHFSYSKNRRKFARLVSDGEGEHVEAIMEKTGDYFNTYPMYMYPQNWTYGASTGNDAEPYLKLVLPWRRSSENGHYATQKQFYYKIVIPDDLRGDEFHRRFVRNNWYHYNIDVAILGAETDDAAVTITSGSCFMVYWQDKDVVVKQAEIGSARYLSVERNDFSLYNVNDETVRYVTSHAVIIKPGSIRVTRPYYGESAAGTNTLGGTVRKAGANDIYPEGSMYLEYSQSQREAKNGGKDWFTNTGVAIEFHHELENNYTLADFDYSPYTISFALVHEDRPDDPEYTKEISIYQRPAVYIVATANSDDTVKKKGDVYTSDHWGYVFVDGEQIVRPRKGKDSDLGPTVPEWQAQGFDYGDDPEEYHWRIIWLTAGSRDIFKINASVLPPNADFVLGDPRVDEIDNLGKSFNTFDALDGTRRSLMYYYPTESSDRTVNMMAPSYRIASKHGGIEYGGIDYQRALYRCATYQEDGFPAGRWRLPTKGEIRFIAMLSSNNAFTFLFSPNSAYWSANGCVIPKSGGGVDDSNKTVALTRCVYDTWYWGDEQQEDRNHPVWGDAQR